MRVSPWSNYVHVVEMCGRTRRPGSKHYMYTYVLDLARSRCRILATP